MKNLKFDAFDTKKLDEYAERAKAQWGKTEAWQEFEQKSRGRTKQQDQLLAGDMMDIFRRFGEIRQEEPGCAEAQALAKELQDFITVNYYNCTKEILRSLAGMYDGGGEFTDNIDRAGGSGTAAFAAAAIRIYTQKAD